MAKLNEPTDAELRLIEDMMLLDDLMEDGDLDLEALVAADADTEEALLEQIARFEGDEAYDW